MGRGGGFLEVILSYGCGLRKEYLSCSQEQNAVTAEAFRTNSICGIYFSTFPGSVYTCRSIMMNFPYTYISCPCNDVSTPSNKGTMVQDDEEEQERTFDPRSRRANFSLYPLEHLLYCEDCQQIRCSRCTVEEIVCWYCPSCLFEMPLSVLKSEGPR